MPGIDELARLNEELDRAEIRDVVMRYCRGVDRLDEEILRSAYHPDAYDDHGHLRGPVDEFVPAVLSILREDFVSTSHNITTQLITIEGDRAFGESYFISASRRFVDGQAINFLRFGRYVDIFERRDHQWRISRRSVVIDSQRSDVVGSDMSGISKMTSGSRDRCDPSYAR